MLRRSACALTFALVLSAPSFAQTPPTPTQIEFFEKKIRPLLAANCLQCHGNDPKKIRGGLRLTGRAELLKGGDNGPSLVPGDTAKSLIVQVLGHDGDIRMPPKGKMKDADIADLTAWVKMGAPWPGAAELTPVNPNPNAPLFTDAQKQFWAFQAMKAHPQPAVKNAAWVRSPIDAFVLSKLEEKNLAPAAQADKLHLIRRVTYDLIGLPPTPEEIDAFLADASPEAFAKVVDRLLQSPAYGQRWGRHWLDVARYADSNGLDENTAFGNAWRYRDYVIDSLNADKPYNQFVIEQIAGDLLPAHADPEVNRQRLTATGFLVMGPKVLAEPDKGKMVMDIVDEQIDVMSKAMIGITISCARCHDHKFDPIPTRDYYAIAGIFKSTRTMESLNTVAKVFERPLPFPELLEKKAQHQKKIDALTAELNAFIAMQKDEITKSVRRDAVKYLLATSELSNEAANGVSKLAEFGDKKPTLPDLLLLEAEKFASGDVTIDRNEYGKKIGVVHSGGRGNAFVQYEIDLPKDATYRMEVRYASAESRPVSIKLDGVVIKATACNENTGGFFAEQQKWNVEGSFVLKAGKHTLRIDQGIPNGLPHIDKIALYPVEVKEPANTNVRRRTGSLPEVAKKFGVVQHFVTNLHGQLQKSSDKHPVVGPWIALANLPEEKFAERAAELIAKWKTDKTYRPDVLKLFDDAPKSLNEVAERYGKLFAESKDGEVTKFVSDVLLKLPGKVEDLFAADAQKTIAKFNTDLAAMKKDAPVVPMVIAVQDGSKASSVKVHIRGNHLTLGEDAPRIFPQIIAGQKQTPITSATESGRLQLANWIADPKNPLTARVMVNRVWQHHFGEGIVRTSDNFGRLGETPTHPELLDWLALNFIENGWSLKKLHRTILLSNTYQMAVRQDAKSALADPDNRLLWTFHRRRLEAEAIRDGILYVAGNLDQTPNGTLLNTPNFGYVTNDQSGNGARYTSNRRSIYLPVIRNAVFDFFQVFDFVEPSVMNGKRATTVVSPQALFLMNSPFVMEQSKSFATQLLKVEDERARVRLMYRKAFGRLPTATEEHQSLEYVKLFTVALEAKEKDVNARTLTAWTSLCQVLLASNEFIYLN